MKKIVISFLCVLCLVGCKAPQEIAYFQDAGKTDRVINQINAKPITIHPGDVVSIVVHSRDPQLAALFNLSIQGTTIGQTARINGSSQAITPFTVDANGYIDYPVLGPIKVQGFTRDELASSIKKQLVDGNHCKDAIVTVELSNVYINVLGEVTLPGRYTLTKDRVTILDALGMAGDLTIQGRRDDVILLRHEGDATITYHLNLLSFEQVASSPAYYLQQDDVIYVEPNDYRKRQTTVNGNNALSTGFWVSVASLLMTILNIAIK